MERRFLVWAVLLTFVVLLLPLLFAGCESLDVPGTEQAVTTTVTTQTSGTGTTLEAPSGTGAATTLGEPPTPATSANSSTTEAGPGFALITPQLSELEVIDGWNRYEETDPRVVLSGFWSVGWSPGASGDGLAWGAFSNCTVRFRFEGTCFRYVAQVEPRNGWARIRLDGNSTVLAEIDLYSPAEKANQVVYTSPALSNGQHDVIIEWKGIKNPAAETDTCAISFDAVEVKGTLVDPN